MLTIEVGLGIGLVLKGGSEVGTRLGSGLTVEIGLDNGLGTLVGGSFDVTGLVTGLGTGFEIEGWTVLTVETGLGLGIF